MRDSESVIIIDKDIDILGLLIINIIVVILDGNSINGYKDKEENNFYRWNRFVIVIVLVLLSLQDGSTYYQILFYYSIGFFNLVESS